MRSSIFVIEQQDRHGSFQPMAGKSYGHGDTGKAMLKLLKQENPGNTYRMVKYIRQLADA